MVELVCLGVHGSWLEADQRNAGRDHQVTTAAGATVVQPTFFTAGTFHDPSMMDGFFSLGQYSRIIRTKSPDGDGSQFDSLSWPGESFWM